ncbi:hypothetical protein CC79DRAFT_1325565 [Sarocladium strictum]
MAFYSMPSYRPDRDAGNSNGIYWQETDGDDLFSQFLDFDPDAPTASVAAAGNSHNHNHINGGLISPDGSSMPPTLAAPSSIGSVSDELDFLSSSSQAHQEEMALFAGSGAFSATGGGHNVGDDFDFGLANPAMMIPRASMSDTDLPRLEGISLESPKKKKAPISDPSSPTPPNTVRAAATGKRGGNKFVEALSSTIRKATNIRGRSTRRAADQQQQQAERGASPGAEAPLRRKKTRQPTAAVKKEEQELATPAEIPAAIQQGQNGGHHQQLHHTTSMTFVQGYCDDPFTEPTPQHARFFSTANTPQESPMAPAEPMFHHANGHTDPLPQGPAWVPNEQQWDANTANNPGWWDMNLVNQNQEQLLAGQRQQQQQQQFHSGEMAFEYNNQQAVQDTGSGGLMIQMPHHQQQQSMISNGPGGELALTAQTYLPPPTPASEPRPSRPPRAKSSGARHMSTSPMRKTRAPSASPTRRNSRHSSGGSISSIRSVSGSNNMPGTPCSVKKRRSRDVSNPGASAAAAAAAAVNSQIEVGFVNFTPSDGGVLMTGVAPSGSSKTKARREKEAVEKRRRMSEAAMKAVAAAGGDVDKLIEQGFSF